MARSAWTTLIVLSLVGWGGMSQAEAGLFSRLASAPQPGPAVIASPAVDTAAFEAAISPEASDCARCYEPCIRYRHWGRKLCGCCEPYVGQVLCVTNPRTCCKAEVPVCLPACCTGCPTVTRRCALLGGSVVTYRWCCGVSVTVRFDRCGDVLVTYHGA